LIASHDRWQSAQPDLCAQGIHDTQHVFQSHGWLAGFKIDNETHANPCAKSQLGLRQPELLASGTQCLAELLR